MRGTRGRVRGASVGCLCAATLLLCSLLAPGRAAAVELPGPGEPVEVERILSSMTLEEKVGQMLGVRASGIFANPRSAGWRRTLDEVKTLGVGAKADIQAVKLP